MKQIDSSDFEHSLNSSKNYKGFCQIYTHAPDQFGLNFSRIPMRSMIGPTPPATRFYSTVEEALTSAISKVERMGKVLSPSHITTINEYGGTPA